MEQLIRKARKRMSFEVDSLTKTAIYNEIKTKYDSLNDSKKREYYERIVDIFHLKNRLA